MPSLFDFPSLKALRFERTIAALRSTPNSAADFFSNGQAGVLLPFRKETPRGARNIVAAYDFEAAKKVQAVSASTDSKAKPLGGRAAALSMAQAGHLVYLRYKDLLSPQNKTGNETLLNVATMNDLPLPPVISSGAICSDTSGFEGDALLAQTEDGFWHSYFVPAYAPNDLTGKQVVYTAQIGVLDACGAPFDGACCTNDFVPYAMRQKLCLYHIDRHFEAHDKRTGLHPLFLANGQTPGPFRLGALMTVALPQGRIIEGALYTGGKKKTTGYGWGEDNFIVPLLRRTDDKGITHVTLYPALTKAVVFSDERGTIKTAKPALLPSVIEPLMQRDFARPTPRLDCPVHYKISTSATFG